MKLTVYWMKKFKKFPIPTKIEDVEVPLQLLEKQPDHITIDDLQDVADRTRYNTRIRTSNFYRLIMNVYSETSDADFVVIYPPKGYGFDDIILLSIKTMELYIDKLNRDRDNWYKPGKEE